MHTDIKRSYLVVGVLAIVLSLGFMIYRTWFFDASVASQQTINQKIQQLPKNPQGQLVASPQSFGLKRAQIALGEYQKNVTESSRGCNCGPGVTTYTQGKIIQWCTAFASWVTQAAGSPVINEKNKTWEITNSRDFAAYLQAHGTWYSREQISAEHLQPQPGDFIVYWRGNYEDKLGHVDVMISPGSSFGKANLIGGNINDRVEYRENYSYLDSYGFMGFGRPEK